MSDPFAWQAYGAWGRVTRAPHLVARPRFAGEVAALLETVRVQDARVLGVGLGRSYGDSGLNPDGRLISCRDMDRFISFDPASGVLRAQGGVSLDAVLRMSVPRGWFLPTTPGSRFVTLAGAVANDVHGKNHHRAGSLGCHVRRIGLIRSDRGPVELSPSEEPELFFATIGGLGLTGFIHWVELRLTPIPSGYLDQEAVAFSGVEGFFDLVADSEARFEHVAAWIDCSAAGSALGRGVMFRANWAPDGDLAAHDPRQNLKVPFEAPDWALNSLTIKAFNQLYYTRQAAKRGLRQAPYAAVFYPLDAIGDWNRLYGPMGFYQHQFVVPPAQQRTAMRAVLTQIAASGQGSFLAVLKTLGDRASGGVLSFPMAGASLALDFPNRGAETLALLDRLDRIVVEAGGRVYPAKDGRMSVRTFRAGYPRWAELEARRDPLFQSAFWRRVNP
jgi:L-gulonolactone oxidase